MRYNGILSHREKTFAKPCLNKIDEHEKNPEFFEQSVIYLNLHTLQCQISVPPLVNFRDFCCTLFSYMDTPLPPPLAPTLRLLNFLRKYLPPSKFYCSFFREYFSTEIVIVSSIFDEFNIWIRKILFFSVIIDK